MIYTKSNLEHMARVADAAARMAMAEHAIREAHAAGVANDQARYEAAMRRHDWAMQRPASTPTYPPRTRP